MKKIIDSLYDTEVLNELSDFELDELYKLIQREISSRSKKNGKSAYRIISILNQKEAFQELSLITGFRFSFLQKCMKSDNHIFNFTDEEVERLSRFISLERCPILCRTKKFVDELIF